MRYGQICIVGEAWGQHEERARAPFVGPSGYELTRILDEAGIARRECYLTNVFNLRPVNNEIETLCGEPRLPGRGPLAKGKYLSAEYAPELDRLMSELRDMQPNIVLGLGGSALWALCGATGITKTRGTVQAAPFLARRDGLPQKFIGTYHPAAVLRQWNLRPTVVFDCLKAAREAEFPEIKRPRREVWIEPTLKDIELFFNTYLRTARSIAYDIETAFGEITMVGFAPDPGRAIVIPFRDPRRPDKNYWAFAEEEVAAWQWVIHILNLPCPKVAQNGVYDISFLWRKMGIKVRNAAEDTMLAHHALQPESPKALGFLGSIYTNEASWKLMRDKMGERRDK